MWEYVIKSWTVGSCERAWAHDAVVFVTIMLVVAVAAMFTGIYEAIQEEKK